MCENTNQTDRRKAQEYLDAKLATIAQAKVTGQGVITSEQRRITVRQRLEALLLDFELRKVRSLAQVRAHLGFPPPSKAPDQKPTAPTRILEAFGTWRVIDLSATAIDRYVKARIPTGAQPATVNRETQLLGQAVQPFLATLGLPALSIRRLPEQNVRQGFFEKPDFEQLVAALRGEALQDMARFAFRSGWRRGEIDSLRWPDVDRAARVIRLRPEATKNGCGRTLALDTELAALIERRWIAREYQVADGTVALSPLVFHRLGKPIVDFRKAWRTACEAAGVSGRLFRTAVRNMVRAGVRETVAMAVSGHKTRSMFDRYNIVSESDLREAMEQTGAYVSQLSAGTNIVPLVSRAEGAR
jgi:integrase